MSKKATKNADMKWSTFQVSDYLDSEEMIAEYLTLVAQDDDPDLLLKALADVAKARGMAKVAKDSGLGRESLYKALSPGAKPRYETIAAVMKALNLQIEITGVKQGS